MVRRHAVVIGWTFGGSSQLDWDCDTSVQCVLNNYLSYFSGGSSGIPLMHAVRGGTAGELSLPSARLCSQLLLNHRAKGSAVSSCLGMYKDSMLPLLFLALLLLALLQHPGSDWSIFDAAVSHCHHPTK